MLALEGGTMLNSQFVDCEAVIVRGDRPIRGATLFRVCTINRCKLFRVTFVVNVQMYQALPAEAKAGLTVISDGRVGDL